MKKKPRDNVLSLTVVNVVILTLCSGCEPAGRVELVTFLRETLLNATSALLL